MTESATSNWLNEDRISGLLRLYFCFTDILSSSIFLQGVDQEILPCGRIDDDDDEDEEVDHTDTHNEENLRTMTAATLPRMPAPPNNGIAIPSKQSSV